jgi:4'-phosphopantetheinyl transferase
MRPGSSFELQGRDIHVWTLRTAASRNVIAEFEGILAPDEKRRAAQFRLGRPRESYILTRAILRYLLGSYLGQRPASIQLEYRANGKPALVPDAGIRFNVTHSGDMAALALTNCCDIGIDLEQLRPLPEFDQIAASFFCSEEIAEINLPSGEERERAFFNCWTRKEAYVKASGVGLSRPLKSFRVTVKASTPVRLVFLDDEINASRSWTLHDLQLGSDYASAIAYSDRQRPLSMFSVNDPAQCLNNR